MVTWFGGPTPSAARNNEEFPAGPHIVYVSNAGGGITEVNATNNSVIATAPFANNANSIAATPDGRRMYVSNRDVGQVTVFDTQRNVPASVIPVGNGNDNLGLAISPDGSVVYVANQFSGTVTVIATASNAVVKTIPTGAEPIWITFSADGSRAYVDSDSLFHGFVLSNGQFRTIDFRNSTFTWITGISQEGDLVGFYNSQDGVQHGFVQRDGKFISVDRREFDRR